MRLSLRRDEGFALLLVLGGLVLIVVVVLAFLNSTTTELKSSKVYADGGSVQRFSDTAVNVIIGQIRDATRSRDASGRGLAWASQPGMIRTYDDTGKASGYYKLYSSGTMAGSGAFNPAAASETVPANWDADIEIYTDLNEPMSGRYPIVDPGAIGKVEGFSVDKNAGAVSGKANSLPMPVRWLYMLEDGTLVAPSGDGKSATVSGATEANPIVARVAFWTDDETSKVNINTASEGTYWDLPRVNSVADVQLSINQPALNEFQRYSGHPATTSLSAVLGWKLPMTGKDGVYTYSQLLPYYSLAPRISEGGSKAGTVSSDTVQKVIPDKDRLYATVDELGFRPDRTPNSGAAIPLTPEDIDKVRFFLTTTSRAPDVNLFNRPRVITWPISSQTDANRRTIWDNAIAFCGTIGGQAFYFQRNNPDDPSADLDLGNNRNLLNYLQELTSNPIPGFGGNFGDKYSDDRDQILTEIFDYIRCTNLCDNNGDEAGPFVSFTNRKATVVGGGKGQVVPIYHESWGTRGFGRFPTLSEAAFVFINGNDDYQAAMSTPVASAIPATKLQMRTALLLELFDPALGFPVRLGNYKIKVSGLESFTWPDGNAMFTGVTPLTFVHKAITIGYAPVEHARDFGGNEGFRALLAKNTTNTLISNLSDYFPVGGTFEFKGGPVTVEFQNKLGVTVQTINLFFPAATIPLPKAVDVSGTPISETNAKTNLRNFDPGGNGRFSSISAGPDGAWVSQFDTVRSLSARDGDYRLVAASRTVSDTGASSDLFAPLTSTTSPLADYYSSTVSWSHTLREAIGDPFFGASRGSLVKDAPYWRATLAANNTFPNPGTNANSNMLYAKTKVGGGLATQCGDQDLSYNGVALGKHGPFVAGDIPGDWDNGFGDVQDGPYINKPDEGVYVKFSEGANGPYYYQANISPAVDVGGALFSPNRQIPSAGMFGSLSSGVKVNRPWQTLLFRPDPSGRHPGARDRKGDGTNLAGAPPDHLLLDLFQMPVVEPYPISEPLSTAGRINMNSQIVPFTYITRDTGIRAVMKSERLLAVDNRGTIQNADRGTSAVDYKQNIDAVGSSKTGKLSTVDWRKDVDLNETLKGFTQRFSTGEIFRSASEICEIPLIPSGNTYAEASSTTTDFWYANYPLTGDNSREKPYATIYPRLTTKSNTYVVHYRVQSLKKSRARSIGAPAEFDTSKGDAITGEYRGYSLIERYVDANDKGLPDFSTAALDDATKDIDSHYRYRVSRSKQFAPR